MKLAIGSLFVIVILGFGLSNAYATDLGAKVIPNMLVEDSEGMIQIFALQNDKMFPATIDDLTIVSSDSSVVQIMETEKTDQSFIKNIKIKAKSPGTAILGIVATGYSSIELPITVYEALQREKQFLVEVAPDTFTHNGPKTGYFAIQLVDSGNTPVSAVEDLLINVTSSSKNIVSIPDSKIVIPKGEYFTVGEFTVHGEGQANLFFSSESLEEISKDIEVIGEKDLDVQLYAYPEKINSHQSSKGFIIAQLQDEDGKPVVAKNTIPVHYQVTGSNYTDSVNTSDIFNGLEGNGSFNIQQGSYWGYTTYNTLSGAEDIYDVTISSENPLSYELRNVNVTSIDLYDDKVVNFEAFPMLTTGKTELIGIAFLESADGSPVIAEHDILVKVGTSHSRIISPQTATIYEGESAALVYADMSSGSIGDEEFELHVVSERIEPVAAEVFSFGTNSTDLEAHPLISKVIPGTIFPLAVNLVDEDDAVTPFPYTDNVFVESGDTIKASPKVAKNGDSVSLVNLQAIEIGTDKLHVQYDKFFTDSTIDVMDVHQHNLLLDGPQSIFAGVENMFTVQIVDDEDRPVFANHDVNVKIIVKDPSILTIPNDVVIKQGTYYTSFIVEPNKIGSTEVTVTADDMPLSRFAITTDSFDPVIKFEIPDKEIESGTTFISKVLVSYNEMPLENVNVEWTVDNALIQGSSDKTNANGESNVALLATDSGHVKITAKVSDDFFFKKTVGKTIPILGIDLPVDESISEPEFEAFTVGGIDPLLVTIPGAIGAVGFMLQRKGKMTMKKPSSDPESF